MSAQARWECCGALVGRKHSPTCDRQTATEFQRPLSLLDASGCLCAGGDCEGCNALAEAWEAMREALSYALSHIMAPDWQRVADALTLADKVMIRDR